MAQVLAQYEEGLISKGEVLAYLASLIMQREKAEVDQLWLANQGYVP